MNLSSSISSRERLPPDRFEGMGRAHHLLGTMPPGIHTGQESIDFRCLIDRTWETTEESNPTAGIDTGWERGLPSGPEMMVASAWSDRPGGPPEGDPVPAKTAAVATPDPPRTRATSRDRGGQGWLRAVDRQHDRIGGEGAPNSEQEAVSTGALLSARDDEREDGGRSRTGRPLRPTAPYDPGSGITGHTKLLTTPRSVAPAPVGSASADASSAFVSITPSAFRS